MNSRALRVWPLVALMAVSTARAGSHGSGHMGMHHGGHGPVPPGFYVGVGGGMSWGYFSPVLFMNPVGTAPFFGPFLPPLSAETMAIDRGGLLAGPLPNRRLAALQAAPGAGRPRRADPARAAQLVVLGDRLFKAGNTRRAEDRYEQAVRADLSSAAPHVRLAQLALVRGQYAEAANQFREAQGAEPGWLVNAPDVQALYAEPGDFARHIAKLESHLQANPNDRAAWLVLGAEWFLSGRTRQAADVFVRLSDRQPDATLAAFSDATTPREPARAD